jgi:hypothetical protein
MRTWLSPTGPLRDTATLDVPVAHGYYSAARQVSTR